MRGKVLGGSSSINVMGLYPAATAATTTAGRRRVHAAGPYADVLPYFNRAETWERGRQHLARRRRPARHPIRQDAGSDLRRLARAAKQSGYPFTEDYNGKQQEGRSAAASTPSATGWRSSTVARVPAAGQGPAQPHRRDQRACDAAHDLGHARDRRRIRQRGFRRPQAGLKRKRGHRRERHVQLAAAADAVRNWTGRSTCARWELRASPTCRLGKNLQDHIGAYMTYSRKKPGVFHGEMWFDRMAVSMLMAYFHGKRPGDGGARRIARLRQDTAGAGGARHRVHVPWHLASSASVVPVCLSRFCRRLRHPADAHASGQPRRVSRCAPSDPRAGARASVTTS